jgi:hypothetical protein
MPINHEIRGAKRRRIGSPAMGPPPFQLPFQYMALFLLMSTLDQKKPTSLQLAPKFILKLVPSLLPGVYSFLALSLGAAPMNQNRDKLTKCLRRHLFIGFLKQNPGFLQIVHRLCWEVQEKMYRFPKPQMPMLSLVRMIPQYFFHLRKMIGNLVCASDTSNEIILDIYLTSNKSKHYCLSVNMTCTDRMIVSFSVCLRDEYGDILLEYSDVEASDLTRRQFSNGIPPNELTLNSKQKNCASNIRTPVHSLSIFYTNQVRVPYLDPKSKFNDTLDLKIISCDVYRRLSL